MILLSLLLFISNAVYSMDPELLARKQMQSNRASSLDSLEAAVTNIAGWGKRLVEAPDGVLSGELKKSIQQNVRLQAVITRIDKKDESLKTSKTLKYLQKDEQFYLVHYAAENGRFKELNVLLEKIPFDLKEYRHVYTHGSEPDKYYSLTGLAILEQDIELVKRLKEYGIKTTSKDWELLVELSNNLQSSLELDKLDEIGNLLSPLRKRMEYGIAQLKAEPDNLADTNHWRLFFQRKSTRPIIAKEFRSKYKKLFDAIKNNDPKEIDDFFGHESFSGKFEQVGEAVIPVIRPENLELTNYTKLYFVHIAAKYKKFRALKKIITKLNPNLYEYKLQYSTKIGGEDHKMYSLLELAQLINDKELERDLLDHGLRE